jgi:hypothetical protein
MYFVRAIREDVIGSGPPPADSLSGLSYGAIHWCATAFSASNSPHCAPAQVLDLARPSPRGAHFTGYAYCANRAS